MTKILEEVASLKYFFIHMKIFAIASLVRRKFVGVVVLSVFLISPMCFAIPVPSWFWTFALKVQLGRRCLDHGRPMSVPVRSCFKSTSSLAKLLSFQVAGFKSKKETKGMAAFHKDLIVLLHDLETITYLRKLGEILDSQSYSQNLFQVTRNFANGDRLKALKWIAILFQDTSPARAHLRYLENKLKGQLIDEQKLLYGVIDRIAQAPSAWLYPEGISSHSAAQYHFYVNAYLTHMLQNKKNITTAMVTYSPFLFNTIYEFKTVLCQKVTSRSLPLGILELTQFTDNVQISCHNPKQIDRDRYSEMLEDIYLGYAGPRWILEQEIPIREDFINAFAENPRGYLEIPSG